MKQWEIKVTGSHLNDEIFAELAHNELFGGSDIHYGSRKIIYTSQLFCNAREDMQYFKEWLVRKGYEPICENKNRTIRTAGGEFRAELTTIQVIAIPLP